MHTVVSLLCMALLSNQPVWSTPVSELAAGGGPDASPALSAQYLDSLTTRIVEKELELLRLNTHLRIESTDRGRLKPWRVFLWNLAGAGVSNAGIITVSAERWRTWQRPRTASRNTLKAGPMLLMIGHSILVGGLLLEATIDTIKDYRIRKRGFDAKTTKKRALALKDEIDRLMSERDRVTAGSAELSEQERAVARQEGKVLADVRDLALNEYCQFYARAVGRRWSRDASYLNGLAAAGTGGYIGALGGLIAVAARRPSVAGPAGIGFILSGSHIVAAPVVGRVTAKLGAKLASRKVRRELGLIAAADGHAFDADRDALRQAASGLQGAGSSPGLSARLAVYDSQDSIFDAQGLMNAGERKKADRAFLERLVWNGAIGGTKIAWGTLLSYAGFRYYNSPQRFSKSIAQGSTCFVVGTGLFILDTLQAHTRSERDVYAMGLQQALPHQKLQARLSRLEQLDEMLKRGQ
ncbi:MAG TPA: hypothetical protein V6D08_09215 [Candidatus Obscuribacterales bacterium]